MYGISDKYSLMYEEMDNEEMLHTININMIKM